MKRPKRHKSKNIVLGLVGTFGSGKTTVAGYFRLLGAKVIDADLIAHSIIRPPGQVYKKIVRTFGARVLGKNRAIDRVRLGRLVFRDAKLVRKLNRITHPAIIRIIKDKIRRAKERVIVLDAPLLVEAGLERSADKLITVKAGRKNQLGRLLRRTRLNKDQILERLKAQIPISDKIRIADFVIDNNGLRKETRKQVVKIWRLLWKN
jgi:dephospho-CoA kinase